MPSTRYVANCHAGQAGCETPHESSQRLQTEVIKSNVNPRWQRFRIPIQALCNGDVHRPLLIQCFDWNKGNKGTSSGRRQMQHGLLLTWLS